MEGRRQLQVPLETRTLQVTLGGTDTAGHPRGTDTAGHPGGTDTAGHPRGTDTAAAFGEPLYRIDTGASMSNPGILLLAYELQDQGLPMSTML